MERVNLGDDWYLELDTPECDLKYDGCIGGAYSAVRIHDCAFNYACEHCHRLLQERMVESFSTYAKMRCKKCKRPFNMGKYVETQKL